MNIKQKTNIYLWQLFVFGVVSLLGTLLHFWYDWAASPVIALFSAVNESTWEHMKLLFFPMLFFTILESIFIGKKAGIFGVSSSRRSPWFSSHSDIILYTQRYFRHYPGFD